MDKSDRQHAGKAGGVELNGPKAAGREQVLGLLNYMHDEARAGCWRRELVIA